jgi:uncharacterized protein YggU (UPF0235/DUF167 family)
VEGAANSAIFRLLADVIGVPPSAVSIERGARARIKTVTVAGTSVEDLRKRWPGGTFESAAR